MFFKIKKVDNVSFIRIDNEHGLDLILSSFGASIYNLEVIGRANLMESIIMTPDNLSDFYNAGAHYGKTVGRFAGRIANHTCNIDGISYDLLDNAQGNSLHGGKYGLAFVNFNYEIIEDKHNIQVIFRHTEKENDLPGDVSYEITYTVLKDKNEFRIDFNATTNKNTLVNLTNHTYFNLSGNLRRTILDETLKLYCDRYTNLDEHMITKSIDKVNKVMSFERTHKIKNHITDESLLNHPANGYDHCYLKKDEKKDLVAILTDRRSQRRMKVYTSYPSIVIYTCNYPDTFTFKPNNIISKKHSGICFECQYVPNGINMENVEKAILHKNEKYHHYIRYEFEKL